MRHGFAIVFTLAAAVVSTSASLVVRSTTRSACYYVCSTQVSSSCGSTDFSCLCKDASFFAGVTACVRKSCSGDDIETALNAGNEACLAVGVTLSASSTASSTGTSAGTTPTSSASSSASASAATTSSAAATAHGVNAFIGLAAVGLVAIALQ